MDNFFLTQNYILTVAVLGWGSAQLIKFIIHLAFKKKANFERLFGSGGMPSSHTATVCGMVIATGRKVGEASPLFAIAFVVAAIAIYDAMGVRRAAGEHARVINLIVDEIKQDDIDIGEEDMEIFDPTDKPLKEFLGHTPMEVLAGALLGILLAMMIPVY